MNKQPEVKFFCTITSTEGSDCGKPAVAMLTAFGESLTIYTCETDRTVALTFMVDQTHSSEGFGYRPLT